MKACNSLWLRQTRWNHTTYGTSNRLVQFLAQLPRLACHLVALCVCTVVRHQLPRCSAPPGQLLLLELDHSGRVTCREVADNERARACRGAWRGRASGGLPRIRRKTGNEQ
jgi:hypothetical protein